MKIECSKCGSIYQVKAFKIPDKGAYAKCKKCQNRIFIKKQSEKQNEKIAAFKNQPQLREPSVNNQEIITQKPTNIVCSKCGQRQPSSNDKCFKCGFNFNKKDPKTGKTPSTHGLIKKALSAQNKKKIKIPVAGFIAAGLICVFVLFLLIKLIFPYLQSIPGKKDSYTYAQYHQEFVQWEKKCFLEDYHRFGHHSPQWDSKVKEVLDKYAVYCLGLYDDDYAYEIQNDFQKIIDMGCKDPRIFYIYGNIIFRNGNVERAEIIVNSSLKGLEKSEYPDSYRFVAANKLINIYEQLKYDDEEMFDLLYEKKMKYLARAAADDRFKNGNQRYYIADLYYQWKKWGGHPRGLEKFMEEYEQLKNVDPWIDLMVRGMYHKTCGWDARGTGYANTVTQDGWEVFKSELETAASYLINAHNMHPEFPEAAVHMIHIRMSSNGAMNEKEWFKRAVNAQFDYMPAYEIYLQALRPRWGGSHNEMLKFGTACLNTKRFDTKVPRSFLKSIVEVTRDYEGRNWLQPFRQPGIYKKVRRYFEGVLNEPSEVLNYYRVQSSYALYAWACGEYEDARELISELGEDFIPEVSKELYIEPEQFINDLARR